MGIYFSEWTGLPTVFGTEKFLWEFGVCPVESCGGRSGTPSHTEKSFRNIIKSTRNQIVFTIFRLIWIQTDVRLDPNQSEIGKYNLISG